MPPATSLCYSRGIGFILIWWRIPLIHLRRKTWPSPVSALIAFTHAVSNPNAAPSSSSANSPTPTLASPNTRASRSSPAKDTRRSCSGGLQLNDSVFGPRLIHFMVSCGRVHPFAEVLSWRPARNFVSAQPYSYSPARRGPLPTNCKSPAILPAPPLNLMASLSALHRSKGTSRAATSIKQEHL